MNTENERAAFEEWADARDSRIDTLRDRGIAWRAWQAALSRPAAPGVEEIARAACDGAYGLGYFDSLHPGSAARRCWDAAARAVLALRAPVAEPVAWALRPREGFVRDLMRNDDGRLYLLDAEELRGRQGRDATWDTELVPLYSTPPAARGEVEKARSSFYEAARRCVELDRAFIDKGAPDADGVSPNQEQYDSGNEAEVEMLRAYDALLAAEAAARDARGEAK